MPSDTSTPDELPAPPTREALVPELDPDMFEQPQAIEAEPTDREPHAAIERDSDRLERDSERLNAVDETETVTQPATELEPERVTEDATAVDAPTETGGSLYPGKLSSVRAPGWDQSAYRTREEAKPRHRPESAPELEPASVPNLASIPHDYTPPDMEGPALTPVEDNTTSVPVVPSPKPRNTKPEFTAVSEAAKELARAALQAEIEKEEKRALQSYQAEEGEIPPSPEVAKRFDVILQLGKGGMAVVYLCRDPRRAGRIFAVKDIRAEMKPGMKVEQRVEHEANLLKKLDHPGIVKVYDLMKFQRGSAIVMEYIDGLPLDHEIGAGRRMNWEFGVRILTEIGAALQYAHESGVIHRDIKPDNILWSERSSVMKLVDFGLARIYGDETEVHMTRTGMVVGTPHYMSPEQVSGKPLDGRSDVYSFGATLYYLLTGQRHVEGSNVMDILEQQRSREILPPSHIQRDIPAWLSYIIGKMMEIKPADRYPDMKAMLRDIELAQADPENFLRSPPHGPVKRYGKVELAPAQGEVDFYAEQPEGARESGQAPLPAHSTSRMGARHSTARLAADQHEPADENAQISVLLKQISSRLEKAEKRMVGPGTLVLIVLLCVLIVVLGIIGGLLYAAREGYLAQLLNL
ncbi:MAG: serine/threonine protein kinase [Planctomycetes bacterium]|nr:serine/threonine protein kinase [Planctomycetota bacterium]MCW8137158.1 serine/threonine protein kinase [Planctomycetota bacterium]